MNPPRIVNNNCLWCGWGSVRGVGYNIKFIGNTVWRVEGVGIAITGNNWLVENNNVSHGNIFAWNYAEKALRDGLNGSMWDQNYIVVGDTDALRFFGNGHIIKNNYFHDYLLGETAWAERKTVQNPNPSPHMDCMQTFSNGDPPWQGATNVIIEGNFCFNIGTQFIFISDINNKSDHITIVNNIFKKNGAHGIAVSGIEYLTLANNIIANVSYAAISVGNSPNSKIINNIIYYDYSSDGVFRIDPVIDEVSKVGLTLDYNLHFPNTRVTFPGVYDTNGIFGKDPKFIDPNGNNFHIQNSSVAIDSGSDMSSYLSNDKDGISRPQGSAWDIGAYEYVGSGGVVTPPIISSTPPPAIIIGDFNKNGIVNSIDLSLMVTAWNTNNTTYDLNRDGIVNSLDYVIMVRNWTI